MSKQPDELVDQALTSLPVAHLDTWVSRRAGHCTGEPGQSRFERTAGLVARTVGGHRPRAVPHGRSRVAGIRRRGTDHRNDQRGRENLQNT